MSFYYTLSLSGLVCLDFSLAVAISYSSRGTPVAPCRPKAQGKRITRVGSPRSPAFPNYHELIEEPHHHEAAGDSLTAKGREHT